jgi:hypothetical protein
MFTKCTLNVDDPYFMILFLTYPNDERNFMTKWIKVTTHEFHKLYWDIWMWLTKCGKNRWLGTTFGQHHGQGRSVDLGHGRLTTPMVGRSMPWSTDHLVAPLPLLRSCTYVITQSNTIYTYSHVFKLEVDMSSILVLAIQALRTKHTFDQMVKSSNGQPTFNRLGGAIGIICWEMDDRGRPIDHPLVDRAHGRPPSLPRHAHETILTSQSTLQHYKYPMTLGCL